MPVTKEYRCAVHGDFESTRADPLCPEGCDTVERVFLTPVGFRSERTTNIDNTVRGLAKSHGMTDISNAGGVAAKRQDGAAQSREREFREFLHGRYGDGWGNVPKGGVMNVKTQQVENRPGSGVAGALAAHHAPAGNALEEARPIMAAMGPKPVLVRRDHEGLKVRP